MCERNSLHSAIEIQSSNTAHSLPWYKFTLCISRVHHFMDHIVPVRVFILKARTFTTIFNYQVYYLWWHLQNIYRVCVYACVVQLNEDINVITWRCQTKAWRFQKVQEFTHVVYTLGRPLIFKLIFLCKYSVKFCFCLKLFIYNLNCG